MTGPDDAARATAETVARRSLNDYQSRNLARTATMATLAEFERKQTAERISNSFHERAKRGLYNGGSVPLGFLAAALEYARGFCPPERAALAVGRIKRAVQTGAELPLAAGLALERELQQQLFQSADAKEGISAYVQKRPARFAGK